MANALAQSRRVSGRISLHLTPIRSSHELSLEPSYWTLKLEANPPNSSWVRLFSMQAKPQAQVRKMGALQVSMSSPGFVYEPYSSRDPISFWSSTPYDPKGVSEMKINKEKEPSEISYQVTSHEDSMLQLEKFGKPNLESESVQRPSNLSVNNLIPLVPNQLLELWFSRDGWKRTKEDIILELKSAYAISKLRKSGYSKQKFYKEAVDLYKKINTQMANGDKVLLRKSVTENMYSALKNEIKHRETLWSYVYWELVMPLQKIRTLRARLIGVDRSDLSKVFVQLTLEFISKQKFEAYDFSGAVVAGNKDNEVLVRDIWVFEKSLFHQGAYWRLCGRIKL